MGTPSSSALGLAGEALVRRWLEQQGWHCRAERWHCRWGELDLVMECGDTLACVEVKSRCRAGVDAGGVLALTPAKGQRLWRTAELFLLRHPRWQSSVIRFDLALVRWSSRPVPCGAPWAGGWLHLEQYLRGVIEAAG